MRPLARTWIHPSSISSSWRDRRWRAAHVRRLWLPGAFWVVSLVLAVYAAPGDGLHRLFGAPEDGTAIGTIFFVFILTLLGVVGGAVGGTVEGAAMRRRLDRRA